MLFLVLHPVILDHALGHGKLHLWPSTLDLQHSICAICQDIEGSDSHFSCGNQGGPRRATAFRCRSSLRMTTLKAPGKSYRKGITLMELAEMFPDEESALQWFEDRF